MLQEEISTIQKLINTMIEFCVNYGFQVFGAIIVLILGFAVAHGTYKFILSLCEKKKIDITLSKFLAGSLRMVIFTFALIIALGKFGITIAPFIAALSALAFGASFALQGPIGNYGAGLAIVLSRPFAVGDTVSIAGASGVVKDVKLARTLLIDAEGVEITIPNKCIVGEVLHNSQDKKIVQGVVGVSYDSDPHKSVNLIKEVLQNNNTILAKDKILVGIQDFGDSSINIGFRYWVPTVKYYHALYDVNLAVYQALQRANVAIPFPQRDVHIVSQPSA